MYSNFYKNMFNVGDIYNCKVISGERMNLISSTRYSLSLEDGIGKGIITLPYGVNLRQGGVYQCIVHDISENILTFVLTPEAYLALNAKPDGCGMAEVVALSHEKLAVQYLKEHYILDKKLFCLDWRLMKDAAEIEIVQLIPNCLVPIGIKFQNGEQIDFYDWKAFAKWEKIKSGKDVFVSSFWQVGKIYAFVPGEGTWVENNSKCPVNLLSEPDSHVNYVLGRVVNIPASGLPVVELVRSCFLR